MVERQPHTDECDFAMRVNRYLYPLQTPISDRGAQRKRMDSVRAALSWRLVGCELIECYQ
jgi:hypothetical protein